MAELLPLMRQRFFDADGVPLAGGFLYSYEAGSVTPKATYINRAGVTANTNPIELDADGYADIWIGNGYYKFVLTDSNDVEIWTKDQVAIPNEASLASAFWRDVVYITNADSPYTVSSDHNGKLISIDTTSGSVTINLPEISAVTLPYNVGFKKKVATNTVTINRAGTDTIDGATSKTLETANAACQMIADIDKAPDDWSSLDLGTVADLAVTTAKLAASAVTRAKIDIGAIQSEPTEKSNYSLNGTVGGSALTIALKSAAGTDPTASDPVSIAFRSATATSGLINRRQAVAATSLVVSGGSTLGHTSAVEEFLYIYAIDNAGTIELAVSSALYDEGSLVTTVAEGGAGAADSKTAIYSTTARSNVPLRLVGRMKSTQATAGTWATAIPEISLAFEKPAPHSEVAVHTGNNHGSTNTKIRRFTTTKTSIGSAITYADSATLGSSFTINESGVYSIQYWDVRTSGSERIGLSLNTTGPTVNINSITESERMGSWTFCAAAVTAQYSWTGRLNKGDVVRPHTEGACNTTAAGEAYVRIAKIGN